MPLGRRLAVVAHRAPRREAARYKLQAYLSWPDRRRFRFDHRHVNFSIVGDGTPAIHAERPADMERMRLRIVSSALSHALSCDIAVDKRSQLH